MSVVATIEPLGILQDNLVVLTIVNFTPQLIAMGSIWDQMGLYTVPCSPMVGPWLNPRLTGPKD